jgi:hypothetical protein
MKTNRYEIAFLVGVLALALFASACGVAPGQCANTRTQGNDEFRRWAATVSKNGAAVADDCWNPLVDNDSLSVDNTGEAELNFSACWNGRIFIFTDSGGTFRTEKCRKADYPGSATCVAFGTWYAGLCAGEFLVHSGSASIEKTGTSLSITYLPDKLDLTLVVVLEGSVQVTPVDSFEPTVMGPPQFVAASPTEGWFYFTMPLDQLSTVGGLQPRGVYPVDMLPAVVNELGIGDWMLKVSEKATQEGVLPPNWPKELGGTGQVPPGDGFIVTGGGGALGDPLVGEAIASAVEWPTVLKVGAPAGGTITVAIGGMKADARELTYDPNRSKELLAKAGYPQGFPVTLVFPEEDGRLVEAAKVLARYLQALGLKVQEEAVPGRDLSAVVSRREQSGSETLAVMR